MNVVIVYISALRRMRNAFEMRTFVLPVVFVLSLCGVSTAHASEGTDALRAAPNETEFQVRSWERESLVRARRDRLAVRRLKLESAQVYQGDERAESVGSKSLAGNSPVMQRRELLESARGQPGLTGLEPLPVSLFVP